MMTGQAAITATSTDISGTASAGATAGVSGFASAGATASVTADKPTLPLQLSLLRKGRVYAVSVPGPRLHGRRLHGRRLHGPRLHGRRLHGRRLHGPRLHGRRLHGRRMQSGRLQWRAVLVKQQPRRRKRCRRVVVGECRVAEHQQCNVRQPYGQRQRRHAHGAHPMRHHAPMGCVFAARMG
eukprot:352587-Chlamydomonas_euryale.AAC.12